MATVRPALKAEIERDLDNTAFGKDLFNIQIQKEDFLIKIVYIVKNNFSFCIKDLKEPIANRYHFITQESPGQWMLETEEFQHENFQNARSRVQQWCKRIEDDYIATKPGFEELESIRKRIIEEFDASSITEGEQFSEQEKLERDHRLDEIEEKLENVYREKNADRQQINLMKQQISKLKEAIEVLDKRTWMLAAANRILNIFKEVRTAVGEVQALTRDFDNLLPDLSSESEVDTKSSEQ